MLELSPQERVCMSCKQSFYPEKKVVSKTFCGEEQVCLPPGKSYRAPDCRTYDFCSDECLADFERKLSTCRSVPRWKRLMKKIYRAGYDSGIAGARCHDLHKNVR